MGRRPFSNTRSPNATVALASAAVAAALLASGCSFLFSEGAPENHRALASFPCGDSYAPPVVDVAAAALLTSTAILAARNEDANVAEAAPLDRPQVRHDTNVAIGTLLAVSVIDVASSIYGFRAARGCRGAREERAALVARLRLLPPPYGVPPMGEPPPLWPPPVPAAPPTPPATPSP